MTDIVRWGEARRWADVVVHRDTAYWVEVAEDPAGDTAAQTAQILAQIDETLARLGSDRRHLLQVLIYVSNLNEVAALNAEWDAWVPAGAAPVRACVEAGLAAPHRVEMVITAAVPGNALPKK